MKVCITLILLFSFLNLSSGEIEYAFNKELHNYLMLKVHILDPLREKYPDLLVTSVFRTWPKGSQHNTGQAADIDDYKRSYTNRDIYEFVRDRDSFDQLILEFGTYKKPAHVHFSYVHLDNRNDILRAYRDKYGVVHYKKLN